MIIVAEIVALAVSNQQKSRVRNKQQMYLITALCLSELNGAFTSIVIHVIDGKVPPIGIVIMWFYIHTFFRLTRYSTMALLTLDRFLVFRLNIKYIQCFVVSYETFENTYMHLCYWFYHFYLLCILDHFKVD